MLKPLTTDQMIEIAKQKRTKEQLMLAEQGISTAVTHDQVVTIGLNHNCNYQDFKHFVVAQIFAMGVNKYIELTGWDADELCQDIAEEPSDSTIWRDDVLSWFDGMEGKD